MSMGKTSSKLLLSIQTMEKSKMQNNFTNLLSLTPIGMKKVEFKVGKNSKLLHAPRRDRIFCKDTC